MSEEKLRSDEVPRKLTEWLLEMGCPPEKVPPVEKMSQMCRGQYYMVWRSLMEHVKSKQIIRDRRLQVFCDDVNNYQNRSVFSERGSNKVVPEEILLWRQQTELREKVADAEHSVASCKEGLQELTDKITKKATQRNASQETLQNLQRKTWQLTLVAEDWKNRKTNIEETKTIAESLCNIQQDTEDVKNKLDKCLSVFARPPQSTVASTSLLATNPIACSSVVSTTTDHNDEENIASLVRCGPGLWTELYERRAQLTQRLVAGNTAQEAVHRDYVTTPKTVISHTIALQSTLALEALKLKVHVANTRKRLATAVTELNTYLTPASCELLVLSCERACAHARVSTLRELVNDVTSRRGAFCVEGGLAGAGGTGGVRQIASVDKAIEMKKEELKRLVSSLAVTERKIQNVRDCLLSVFNGLYKDAANHDIANYKGVQLDLPQESISSIRRFYEERRDKKTNKLELSMDLDVSDISTHESDPNNPRLVDELRLYMKKFNLEKNRKLVLESGEKIWIFETLVSSLHRLNLFIQNNESLPPILNPATNVAYNLMKISNQVGDKIELERMIRKLEVVKKAPVVVDLESHEREEAQIHDKIKKRLNGSIFSLQKTTKTLDLGLENLKFWENNSMKKYISNSRRVNGKSYKDYELFYLENLC